MTNCPHGYKNRDLCDMCPIVAEIERLADKIRWPRFAVPDDRPHPWAGRVIELKPPNPKGDA